MHTNWSNCLQCSQTFCLDSSSQEELTLWKLLTLFGETEVGHNVPDRSTWVKLLSGIPILFWNMKFLQPLSGNLNLKSPGDHRSLEPKRVWGRFNSVWNGRENTYGEKGKEFQPKCLWQCRQKRHLWVHMPLVVYSDWQFCTHIPNQHRQSEGCAWSQ